MKHTYHLPRWLAAGASVIALTAAGTVAATTEPPGTTAPGADTTTAGSEAAQSAGPSDCPAVTGEIGTAAPETSSAAETSAVADTQAADTTVAPAETTGESAAGGSTPAVSGPFVQVMDTDEFGPILVDSGCRTLYVFKNDTAGEPTCTDAECTDEWPPLLVPDDSVPGLADELDASLFSVVDHPDGPMLKVGDWPLYHFRDDTEPGQITGQGMDSLWFVVSADGTIVDGGVESTAAAGSDAPAGTGSASSMPSDTSTATTDGY